MDRKTVLVVDDEATIRRLIAGILGTDYTVLEAMDGEAAIDIAKRQKPDLILMDLMMPKMDGYTACSSIKADQATKVIPVVMLTGVGNELNKKLAKEVGGDGYITKPFTPQELLDVIKNLLIKPNH